MRARPSSASCQSFCTERTLYDDQVYWSELHRVAAKEHGVHYYVNRRPSLGRPLLRETAAGRISGFKPFSGGSVSLGGRGYCRSCPIWP